MKMPSINFKRIKTVTLRTILVITLLAVAGFGYYGYGTFSKGYRVGTMVKMSTKGVFFKTNEGQLNLGAYQKEDGHMTSIWNFSVSRSDDEVIESIDQAMEEGKRVKLYYKQKYVALPWRGDTEYMVYKVELLK